jgi:hypothetical protein
LYFAVSSFFEKRRCLFQEVVWEAAPAALKQHIAVCLEIDPTNRPTAEALWKELESEFNNDSPTSETYSNEGITPMMLPQSEHHADR